MLDLLIRGGSVLDGTGAPRRRADVGVRDGRIAVLGAVDEPARRRVDADGLFVAPGFVDIHTHYDAQVFWDPTLSPSPLHGVTTVVGGNCGFSVAPLVPGAGDYLMRMLARVEGIPLESLEAGVDWKWRNTGEYLDRLEGRLLVNAGFLVGHSALRRVVMGESAVDGAASAQQVAAMAHLLGESLAQGGLGFSSSWAPTHHDGDGRPVPSRAATADELLALCREVRAHPGTTLEFIPTVGPFSDAHVELMTAMSLAADRPLNWNLLVVNPASPELHLGQLAASDRAAARGARVVALTPPQVMTVRLSFASGMVLDALPGWAPLFGRPIPERIEALRDPALRAKLREGAAAAQAGPLKAIARWERMRVAETFRPENAAAAGRSLGELARERGADPLDVMLDLAVSEDLRTSFSPPIPPESREVWRARAKVWTDPRALVGASDAGAHLDMLDTFTYTTALLGRGVRENEALTWEEGVRLLTSAPADLYGLHERGRLVPGARADLVLFDPQRIGPGPVHTRADLPAGASRLYAEAEGVERVFVNGAEVVTGKVFRDERPGAVLRSGRDTQTVRAHAGGP